MRVAGRWPPALLHDEDRRRALLAAATVALPALGLYALTLLPDVDFWDTAEFQALGPVLGIAHPTGYPTYTLLLWLASVVFQPFGNEALRANLLSAVLVAAAGGLLAAMVAVLGRRLVIGIAAGAALAIAPPVWSVAVRADPHALHLLLVLVILALLLRWQHLVDAARPADRWLLATAAVYGVSLGNHMLTVLLAPGIALFVFAVAPGLLRRPGMVLACAGALALVTAGLYAYLPLRSAMDPPLDYANPQTLEGLRYIVLAEQFRGSLQPLPPVNDVLATLGSLTVGSLGAFALLTPFGIYEASVRRGPLLGLLGTWFFVIALFALSYSNADIERYHLTPLAAAVLLAGLGAAWLWTALARSVPVPGTRPGQAVEPEGSRRQPRGVEVLAGLVALAILLGPTLAMLPQRFDQLDASDRTAGRHYLETALDLFAPGAVVVSWWSISTTLWYGQFVEGRRHDVWIVDDRTMLDEQLGSAEDVIDRFLGERPVYLIRIEPDLPYFQQRYELVEVMPDPPGGGRVFRVVGHRQPADGRRDHAGG